MSFFKHDTAIIDERVSIGDGTKIWHWTHICSGAQIGKNCVLGQNVYIGPDVVIGDDVKIQNNVSVYSGVEIKDKVFVGPSVVFTNVINPRANIERKQSFQTTVLNVGTSIGANSTIICGCEMGEYCFIGAGAVVTKNIPAFALMYGTPARQHGWVSHSGNTLSFDSNNSAHCTESKTIYTLTNHGISYRSEKNG